MKRTTPRPNNPNRALYQQYADSQLTLADILYNFQQYDIYGIVENTAIYIVENGYMLIEFDSIGYDDDDCVPTLYEASPCKLGDRFDRIAKSLYEDSQPYPIKPIKLN